MQLHDCAPTRLLELATREHYGLTPQQLSLLVAVVLHEAIATRAALRRTVRTDDERDQETAMRAGNEHGGYSNMPPRADVIGGARL